MDKKLVQLVAETQIVKFLKHHGHSILGTNQRRCQYEFDIVSKFRHRGYVHEVRGTTSLTSSPLLHFPKMKVLTLVKGCGIYFPCNEIILHLVRIQSLYKIHVSHYRIEDLL